MEIVYKNTPEKSVDALLHAVTTTSNFKSGIRKKKLYAGIVLVILFMFVLDKALTYQTAILWILSFLVLALFLAYEFAYQIYYIKVCRTKMLKNLVENEHDPKAKRVLRIDDTKVEIGTIERARKYKLTDVKETYDYDNHFCIVMKNGSVVCVPDNSLSKERKDELIKELDRRFEVIEDDGVKYDTPF